MFEFFNASAGKAFGVQMARYFVQNTSTKKELDEKKFALLSARVLKKMNSQIDAFRNENKLNFYKIAQTGNAFKWALRDAGCDDAQVDTLTQWFVVKLKP